MKSESIEGLLFFSEGKISLGGTARRGGLEGEARQGTRSEDPPTYASPSRSAGASGGSDGGERGGRSGIYCSLVPVSILDAPPTPRRCVR